VIEWLNMGGYGFFVWNSYGMLALAIVVEVALLRRHRLRAQASVREAIEEKSQ